MSVEFEKLNAAQLDPGAIVPQGLDNQWVPTRALNRLIKAGKPLVSWKGRKKAVLSEWRRALIYAPQVVVNRVALFNNSIVVDDYSGSDKKNFQELLQRKVIVDYLLTEDAPDQRPTFDISDEKWNRWLDVIQDIKLACVRLDWGKQDDDFRNIAAVFHGYIQNLNMPDRTEHLTNAFKISRKHRESFRKKLIEVASYTFDIASQGKNIVRNDLYKKFICVDDSRIDDGYYDRNKLFAAELKEIFDLRYTVNVPDAFGRYAFTPKGSPDRTVLGDVNQATMQNLLRDNRVKDFVDSLKRMQFAILNDALYLKGLDVLSLADVITIRNTDEWGQYTQSLKSLLRHPMDFAEKIDDVAARFNVLNRKVTDMKIANTKKAAHEIVSRLQPNMMIVVAIGGALMQLMLDPTDASRILVQSLSGPVSIGLAPIAVNLRISASEYVDLGISVNFMRSKVSNGREVWREIQGALKADPHFKFLDEENLGTARDADQSKNEIDWNEVL